MKLSEYARRREITYKAGWMRFQAGRIPGAYKDEFGHVFVPDPVDVRLPRAAVYARVSSHPQKDDLDRQAARLVEYANARGLQVQVVVKEIASGVNGARPKLTKLLRDESWGTLVVEHKDRLSRVGYGWFELFLDMQGRAVDVANPAEDNRTDLMDDFLAISYWFAARLYGLRGSRTRSRRLVAALEAEAAAELAEAVPAEPPAVLAAGGLS